MLKARKLLNFPIPPLFEPPVRGEPLRISGKKKFGISKLESCGYQMVKKSWH